MIEQPPKHDEIEHLLEGNNLLDQIQERISEGDFLPGPGIEREREEELLSLPVWTEAVRVSYCNSYVANSDLRDALDRPLDALSFRGRRGLLLLIDPDSAANWAHACWIASVDVDQNQKIRMVWNNYPPLETPQKRLVRYRRSNDPRENGRLA